MNRPTITTLCGSTRFPEAFALAKMHLSMLGRIVIDLGCFGHSDQPAGAKFLTSDGDESTPEKQGLDQLHFRKIDASDGIFVINVGGYVGSSTKREIAYATALGKTVEWLFAPAAPDTVEGYNARRAAAQEAGIDIYRFAHKAGWVSAKSSEPDFDQEDAEADYSRNVDGVEIGEGWEEIEDEFFARLPLAAVSLPVADGGER